MSLSRFKFAVISLQALNFFGGPGSHSRRQVMMYSFWCIGRCCHATGSKTHGEVGFAVRGGKVFPLVMEAGVRLSETGRRALCVDLPVCNLVIYGNKLFDDDNKMILIHADNNKQKG